MRQVNRQAMQHVFPLSPNCSQLDIRVGHSQGPASLTNAYRLYRHNMHHRCMLAVTCDAKLCAVVATPC
jgi:hypothetical protein